MSAQQVEDAARIRELEDLVNFLQEVRENEKHILARQLHDHFGSVLISAKMDIESVSVRLVDAPPELAVRLRRAQSALEEAVELKRRLIEDLRPSLLDNLGLVTALEWLVAETCRRGNLEYTMEIAGELPMTGPVPITLFRVVEDALARVLKHASAKKISVDLTIDDGTILLIMEDDGEAVAQAGTRAPWLLELASMRQRIKALGGHLDLRCGTKQGTVIEVTVPCAASTA